MATDVDICKAALVAIGTRRTIQSLDENSAEARAIKPIYAMTRDGLLRHQDWNFARRKGALAQISSPAAPDGWMYSYAYPTGALNMLAVTPSISTYIPPVDNGVKQARVIAVDYEPAGDGVNRTIYTNINPAYGIWPAQVTHVNLWDDGFVTLRVKAIAAAIAFPITQKASVADVMEKRYLSALNGAAADDATEANQNYMDFIPDEIACR